MENEAYKIDKEKMVLRNVASARTDISIEPDNLESRSAVAQFTEFIDPQRALGAGISSYH